MASYQRDKHILVLVQTIQACRQISDPCSFILNASSQAEDKLIDLLHADDQVTVPPVYPTSGDSPNWLFSLIPTERFTFTSLGRIKNYIGMQQCETGNFLFALEVHIGCHIYSKHRSQKWHTCILDPTMFQTVSNYINQKLTQTYWQKMDHIQILNILEKDGVQIALE